MRRLAIAVMTLWLLAGCAAQAPGDAPATVEVPTSATGGSAGPVPSRVSTAAPTATMSASDQLPGNVVVGTVTADSSGPCYLVVTDDGQQYALVGSGGAVTRGQRVRALTEQRPSAVDCGPGRQLGLVKLEVSG